MCVGRLFTTVATSDENQWKREIQKKQKEEKEEGNPSDRLRPPAKRQRSLAKSFNRGKEYPGSLHSGGNVSSSVR